MTFGTGSGTGSTATPKREPQALGTQSLPHPHSVPVPHTPQNPHLNPQSHTHPGFAALLGTPAAQEGAFLAQHEGNEFALLQHAQLGLGFLPHSLPQGAGHSSTHSQSHRQSAEVRRGANPDADIDTHTPPLFSRGGFVGAQPDTPIGSNPHSHSHPQLQGRSGLQGEIDSSPLIPRINLVGSHSHSDTNLQGGDIDRLSLPLSSSGAGSGSAVGPGIGLGIGLTGSRSDSDRPPLSSGFNTVGSTTPAILGSGGPGSQGVGGGIPTHPGGSGGGGGGGGGGAGGMPHAGNGSADVGLHASNSNPSLNSGEGTSSKSAPTAAPCGACKFLRRKCTTTCVFASHFQPDQSTRFANVHKIFGASNVAKWLQELPPASRDDAVNSLCYEADARIKDPVYGCVGALFALQQQVVRLQAESAAAQAELARLRALAASQGVTTAGVSFPSPTVHTPDHTPPSRLPPPHPHPSAHQLAMMPPFAPCPPSLMTSVGSMGSMGSMGSIPSMASMASMPNAGAMLMSSMGNGFDHSGQTSSVSLYNNSQLKSGGVYPGLLELTPEQASFLPPVPWGCTL